MKFQNIPLGQKVKVVGGFAFKSERFTNTGIPILRISNIVGDGTVDLSRDIVYYPSSHEAKEFELAESDVVMAMSGATTGKVGRVEKNHIPCLLNQRVAKFVAKDDSILPDYLFWILRSPFYQRAVWSFASGCAQPNISSNQLEAIRIPLSDKAVQKRIASLLSQAESALQKRRQTLALADEFLKSAFLEMFSFYLYGQKQCDKQPIGKVTHFIDYRGKTPRKAASGIPLITAKNVKKGFISDEPREYILKDDYNSWMTRGFPEEGDVLFTTEAPLGNAAILGKLDKVVVGQRIITIQCGKTLKSEYLLYCLLSSVIQSEISKRSTGSTARGIRSKEFEKISIPMPSIDLQNKFAGLVQEVEKLKEKQKQSETQLQNLFNSLMQRAFRGDLVK